MPSANQEAKNKKTIHILSYTHWDREFRFDFETTRLRLVDLIDNLLDIMQEKPAYRHFMMDGQYVLLDDYLEIRPEKRAELQQLARDGRLAVGPWYTLPDSSCVHGESLIRNLMTGLRKSRDFGGAMEIGYNVFSFGQIAQLPQVYAGFGINTIVFYKHMKSDRSPYSEFMWQSPDGTKAYATRLDSQARWNFFFAGHIPIVYDQDPWNKDWQYIKGSLGKLFHMCEPDNYASFHDIRDPQTSFNRDKVKEGFTRALQTIQNTSVPDHLLFFDGTDFTEAHPMIPEIIEAANQELGDQYNVIHSTLEDYVTAMRAHLDNTTPQDIVTGEMRDGPVGSVHSDVCSVHPELKRANSKAENTLFRWAEPFATCAWTAGEKYPAPYFERALKYLFVSQAHDSLHGVGPDSMVKDINNRLLQAQVIAESNAVRSLQAIATRIDTAAIDGADQFLVVYNASSSPRTETVEAYVDVQAEATIDFVALQTADGTPVPMHQLSKEETRAGLYHPRSRNVPIYGTRFHLLFEAQDLPPLGYRIYKIVPQERALYPYPHEDWDPLLTPYDSLLTGPQSAANDSLSLTINSNGTLTITDKSSGRTFNDLNYFSDSGEQGNLYFHMPPTVNQIETTLNTNARISLLIDSPLMAKFRIEITMMLPVEFDRTRNARSTHDAPYTIVTEIILRRSSSYVEIETSFDNTVKDHFLRANIPTGISTDCASVDANMNVNSYPTRVSQDGDFRGQELTRHRQHLFVDLSDDQSGLAILNDAVRDYEVIDPDNGTIALSLVRGVDLRIPCDNRLWMQYPGDDSAQSLQRHTIRYALCPHQGNWETGNVYSHAQSFNTPLRVAQIGKHSGQLPAEQSFISIADTSLILSAVKKCQDRDSVIVRIFNPTDNLVSTTIETGFDIKAAWITDLNEERQDSVELNSSSAAPISASPAKIVTMELEI